MDIHSGIILLQVSVPNGRCLQRFNATLFSSTLPTLRSPSALTPGDPPTLPRVLVPGPTSDFGKVDLSGRGIPELLASFVRALCRIVRKRSECTLRTPYAQSQALPLAGTTSYPAVPCLAKNVVMRFGAKFTLAFPTGSIPRSPSSPRKPALHPFTRG